MQYRFDTADLGSSLRSAATFLKCALEIFKEFNALIFRPAGEAERDPDVRYP